MSNVITLRRKPIKNPERVWKSLTWDLVLDQHRRGVLNPAVLEYLMVGVGLR